jgi:hypothetical protein
MWLSRHANSLALSWQLIKASNMLITLSESLWHQFCRCYPTKQVTRHSSFHWQWINFIRTISCRPYECHSKTNACSRSWIATDTRCKSLNSEKFVLASQSDSLFAVLWGIYTLRLQSFWSCWPKGVPSIIRVNKRFSLFNQGAVWTDFEVRTYIWVLRRAGSFPDLTQSSKFLFSRGLYDGIFIFLITQPDLEMLTGFRTPCMPYPIALNLMKKIQLKSAFYFFNDEEMINYSFTVHSRSSSSSSLSP